MQDFTAPSFVEVASLQKDIYQYSSGELLWQQDWLLEEKGRSDLLLWEQVRDDEQVQSAFKQYNTAICAIPREIVPASESKADVEAANWFADLIGAGATKQSDNNFHGSLKFNNLLEKIVWCDFYGYGVAEIMLHLDAEGLVSLDFEQGGIRVRHRRRFKIDKDFNIRLFHLNADPEGEIMHPSRVWKILGLGADNDDDVYGKGLAHWLYWLVFFKRGGVQSWLLDLEKSASPTPHVQYEDVSKSTDANAIARALSEGKKYISHTKDILVEFLETSRTATTDYKALIDWVNLAITETVLLQSMTTKAMGGKWKGDAHSDTKTGLIENRADYYFESFTDQVIAKLCFYRFGAEVNPPALKRSIKPEALELIIKRDIDAKAIGLRRTEQSTKEVYGEYEVVTPEPETIILDTTQLTALQALITAVAAGQIPPDSAESMCLAYGVTEEQAKSYIDPVRKTLDEAKQVKAEADKKAIANDPFADSTNKPDAKSGAVNPQPENTPQPPPQNFDRGDGYPCGRGYITKDKQCRKSLQGSAKDYAEYLFTKLPKPENVTSNLTN